MKFLSSFSFIVSIAIVFGLIIGRIPYGNLIATLSLIGAMSISISNIPLKLKDFDGKKTAIALILNYFFLSSIIILFSLPFRTTPLFPGFIVMAAAPPAVAVLPLSKIAGGNEKLSLFSLVISYMAAMAIMPVLIYIVFLKMVNPLDLLKYVLILILLPIIISRFIIIKHSTDIINIFFFFVMFPIIGANRNFIFTDAETLFTISLMMAFRTILTGWIAKHAMEKRYGRKDAVSYSLFASFKNEGLVMILSASLFGEKAAIPAIIATIFEIAWVAILELKTRFSNRRMP